MKSISTQQILLNQDQTHTKLLVNYKSFGLNEQDVMVILQIHRFSQEQIDFPTPAQIATHLTVSEEECANILRKLIQQVLLAIDELKIEQNQLSEAYSLNPLWEKLFQEHEENTKGNEK